MRRLCFWLLLLFSPCIVGAEPVPTGIIQAYRQLNDAWNRRDAEAVISLHSPTVKFVDGRDQIMDRGELEKSVRLALEGSSRCEADFHVVSAQTCSGGLIVRTDQERKIEYCDRMATLITEREDRWRETPEGWKIEFIRLRKQIATVEPHAPCQRSNSK